MTYVADNKKAHLVVVPRFLVNTVEETRTGKKSGRNKDQLACAESTVYLAADKNDLHSDPLAGHKPAQFGPLTPKEKHDGYSYWDLLAGFDSIFAAEEAGMRTTINAMQNIQNTMNLNSDKIVTITNQVNKIQHQIKEEQGKDAWVKYVMDGLAIGGAALMGAMIGPEGIVLGVAAAGAIIALQNIKTDGKTWDTWIALGLTAEIPDGKGRRIAEFAVKLGIAVGIGLAVGGLSIGYMGVMAGMEEAGEGFAMAAAKGLGRMVTLRFLPEMIGDLGDAASSVAAAPGRLISWIADNASSIVDSLSTGAGDDTASSASDESSSVADSLDEAESVNSSGVDDSDSEESVEETSEDEFNASRNEEQLEKAEAKTDAKVEEAEEEADGVKSKKMTARQKWMRGLAMGSSIGNQIFEGWTSADGKNGEQMNGIQDLLTAMGVSNSTAGYVSMGVFAVGGLASMGLMLGIGGDAPYMGAKRMQQIMGLLQLTDVAANGSIDVIKGKYDFTFASLAEEQANVQATLTEAQKQTQLFEIAEKPLNNMIQLWAKTNRSTMAAALRIIEDSYAGLRPLQA